MLEKSTTETICLMLRFVADSKSHVLQHYKNDKDEIIIS